ncbi:MAG: GTPase Era [Alphaproteobacteria bacterium]|nr:GTPase Era [Alphaproteobacteria bacterium]
MNQTRSGFVAIIGPTNAGKSTLMNHIMGRKVSIVSHKVQTTRTRMRAVKMIDDTQLIFVDTPGIFKPARRLDRAMVAAAMDAISDADAVLLLIDATKGVTETIKELVKKISNRQSEINNMFAVINKTDAVKKPDLLPIAAELSALANFHTIFMISATKGDGIAAMLESIAAVMPSSPYLFDPTDAPDVPDELYLAELTREKIYKYVHQELPYRIHVVTEKVDKGTDGVLEIYQKIVVNSNNHKKIIVGKGGAQLKQIGMAARLDIQHQWNVSARLHLFVRIEPDWENKRENYEEQGLEFKN